MAGANKTVLLDEKAWSTSGDLFYPGYDGGVGTGIRRRAAVSIQADFKHAGYYTLQFGVTPPLVSNTAFDISGNVVAQAEILWSVKGNFIRRFINVYNATVISGAGEAVLVRVRDASEQSVFVPAPTKYQVTVNLIPGARPNMANGMPPLFTPRTPIANFLSPGNTIAPPYPLPAGPDPIFIPIPKDCGITSVMLNIARGTDEGGLQPLDLTNSQITIEHQNASNTLNRLNYDACYNFQPLAPGTTLLAVYNNTVASDPDDISLVWVTPIFGVDG